MAIRRFEVWEVPSGQVVRPLESHTDHVISCVFSADARFIVSTSWDKTMREWDAGIASLRFLDDMWMPAFSPDGRYIVCVGGDHALRVWSRAKREMLTCLPLPGAPSSLGMHPSEPRIVCGDEAGAVFIVELVGLKWGAPIVTAWHATSGSPLALGCSQCRTWSVIPKSALDSELPCPNCGKPVQLNGFTIDADWKPIAEAWQSK